VTDHVARNQQRWAEWAAEYVDPGHRNWAADEPSWGIWKVPESQLHLLPDDATGLDTIELGCGTAYVSAWLARRGARPVGIDVTEEQLATARALQREHGVDFQLIHGNAEQVPFPDESFDFAISEYGASIWCDPYLWIPEAARLLRPGGQLVFMVNAIALVLCMPEGEGAATDRMVRPQFGLHRIDWEDEVGGTNFYLPHGEMIGLLRRSGFEIEELIEVQPPEGSTTRADFVTLEWARRWPSEEVWKCRKGYLRPPDPKSSA
jgi:SAM-dependent methyltransferase